MWDTSCLDWEARIREGRSLVPDLPLFKDEAEIALEFFEGLRLPDVPGKPQMREACGDWFKDAVRALFGSRNPKTNFREIGELFLMVPKGNSKTTNGAALMITALLMNTRPRAEYLLVGPTQAIADLAFSQAAGMVEAEPDLQRRFKIRDHVKEIVDLTSGAKLKVKTFDLSILTGPKPVGVLVDEIHLLGKMASTSKVLRQIRGGLQKNSESFLVMITTQSDEPPAGAFRDELNMARAVRDGRFKNRTLPMLYEFPTVIAKDQALWEDPDNWPMVMPNLGRSLRLDTLYQDWLTEREKGSHAIVVWCSQHLNIEIGLGLKTDRWPGAEHWEKQADDTLDLDELLARSEVVCVGIDGGGLDDLFGLCVLGRDRDTKQWLCWTHAWCHSGVLDRRKSIAGKLREFEANGELTIVDDQLGDLEAIVEIIRMCHLMGLLSEVGVDPAGLGELVDALAEIEVTEENGTLVGVRQGFGLMTALKTTERRLAKGTFTHSGSGLGAWCVSNIKIEPTATAIRATKQNAGDAKIDVAMAVFNAAYLMSRNPEPKNPRSVYEKRGLLMV